MKRKATQEPVAWYQNSRRKPLVVWGTRQAGKTYLIKDLFADAYFDDYVYIDLKKDSDACSFFSTTSNPET